MIHRPCSECGNVFREPDDNSAVPECPACGHRHPSFDTEEAVRMERAGWVRAIVESAQRGWMTAEQARAVLDHAPAAVIADLRRLGDEERRNQAIGAAPLDSAGWVRAIGVCQAFAALRGGR